jgi:hypothetical protein
MSLARGKKGLTARAKENKKSTDADHPIGGTAAFRRLHEKKPRK